MISTQALLCLSSWSLMGLVHDDDVVKISMLDEVSGQIELDKLTAQLKDAQE